MSPSARHLWAGERCQLCRRHRHRSGCCAALAVLDTPWAQVIAARGPRESTGKHAERLARLQADTDAAEGYRLGLTESCTAFRSRATAPAHERRIA